MYTHTHVCVLTCAHTYTRTYQHMHAPIHAYICTHIRAHIHVYICAHTPTTTSTPTMWPPRSITLDFSRYSRRHSLDETLAFCISVLGLPKQNSTDQVVNTMEMCSLTVLEARRLMPAVSRACLLPEAVEGGSFLAPSGSWWLPWLVAASL